MQAFVDYTMALDRDGGMCKAARARGRLCMKRGEYSEAVRDFELCMDAKEGCKHSGICSQGLAAELEKARNMEKKGGDDHYATLGIDCDATESEVKKAFKKMALKHHPDKQGEGSSEMRSRAERTFKRVTQAYEILSDPVKRREYDLSRPSSTSSSFTGRGGGFGGGGGRGAYGDTDFSWAGGFGGGGRRGGNGHGFGRNRNNK